MPARKPARRPKKSPARIAKAAQTSADATPARTFDALPDPADFRDVLFVPTLAEVPIRMPREDYLAWGVPILDQGSEGACTGFGLATVAHYLLRRRRVVADPMEVSPRMFYEMAKRYDEWPGRDYDGSSPRGAMKGWHKHGVCSREIWSYVPGSADLEFTEVRAREACNRPLGAYFRVNHKDIVAMHTALAEVGILYASAVVHEGWNEPNAEGWIQPMEKILGGHAFAIVGYQEEGFWIQNSWGSGWGLGGLALLGYDDWLEHGMDIWVARLGAPIKLITANATAIAMAAEASKSQSSLSLLEVRPHVVSVGNDGRPRPTGPYGTSATDIKRIFTEFPAATKSWSNPRLLLYAHGGLVAEKGAIQRVADYRPALLENEVYPLAFIWKTDAWTTLTNILQDAVRRRRPEGLVEAAKDFLLDRLDDGLEPLARELTGKLQWDEMKENALRATSDPAGAASLVAEELRALLRSKKPPEIHVAGHSAGSIFMALLVELLTAKGKITAGPLKGRTGLGATIASCTLWAPACTVDLFQQSYLPAIRSGAIENFALYTLTEDAEQDDNCAGIYHKSLLYLVSNAFEARLRIPLLRDGVPLLGMEKFIREDPVLTQLFKSKSSQWVLSPNDSPATSVNASRASHHGDFDDDKATVRSTLARILGARQSKAEFRFAASASSRGDQRRFLAEAARKAV